MMKFIAGDAETTGLRPKDHQILELALVHEDTGDIRPIEDLPHIVVRFHYETLKGQLYALNLNRELIESIEGDPHRVAMVPNIAWGKVAHWLSSLGYSPEGRDNLANLAGQNVGKFDFQWLPESVQAYFHHRLVEAGSMRIDWTQKHLPGLAKTLTETRGREQKHTALADAQDLIRVMRRDYVVESCVELGHDYLADRRGSVWVCARCGTSKDQAS